MCNQTNQTDERSRESSRRMLQLAEREIGRIVLDIHDGPVQNMFAALSQLSIAKQLLSRRFGDDAKDEIDRLQQSATLLERSLDEIRIFMGTFRPPEFERRDLLSVIDGLVIQHEELTGHPVQFSVQGDIPHVSLSVKIGLYRVLQEALSNAARHANVDHHYVSLAPKEEGTMIEMEISDRGEGFDVEAAMEHQTGFHIGLSSMRERVDILGGVLTIRSAPHAGTTIRVVVPCQ